MAAAGLEARRLFFAVWPEESTRAALSALVRRLKPDIDGRWMPPETWHLTLAFLGSVEAERVAEARACGDAVRGEAGRLKLDRVEYWRRPDVLCLTSSLGSAALEGLAVSLADVLRRADFRLEKRPFKAHLTLARKLRRLPQELPQSEPVSWPYRSFGLVESVPADKGSCYQTLHTWPLAAGKLDGRG
ncbi:RNA 2',3'-cyclic phosphodiesterase [Methylococcus sp. EFPC2]|uniref:RNA 2',3'-cyclic phosphodiesterase n=1 Tax=Methylococcus sp. EFPC2 TaxID=2812648 RepID=UPI0019684F6A|nr:RNA 2',3'-cyclic phosphodiesterase [Methylococcus sp. EFPC2]QSA97139.1 RNA 2',3'-cyclic phosphodiesterase [Methylococcus sp. EFPC2]